MSVSDEFEWTPDQTRREHAVLANFSHLIKTERSRYGNQAIQLLEKKYFESEVNGFKLICLVKPNTYLCRIQNQDISGDSYEIEFPIPESKEEMLETLVELFAQSEAKCLIGAH